MTSVLVKVPVLPESVADAVVVKINHQVGDSVTEGDVLFELETDKVMLEVTALSSGSIDKVLVKEGDLVVGDQEIAQIKAGAVGNKNDAKSAKSEKVADAQAAADSSTVSISPAVRRLLHENNLTEGQITVREKNDRIVVEDVEKYLAVSKSQNKDSNGAAATAPDNVGSRYEERVPMTRLRKRVAERLLESQANAAILSTFNEVDMHRVMETRAKYKEDFEKKHGVKLGLSCFFVKAVVAALQEFPDVNASIDGDDVIYHNYMDIGVAIGSERGLLVPVIRNAENLTMANIESKIKDFAGRAQAGKITLDELTGGTFSITNGGVFGSMLSTPIINPPQSGILGMHNITKRPIAVDGQVVIRPMMYLALSYDHRLIDGSVSVRFLVHIKNSLENPERLLLDL